MNAPQKPAPNIPVVITAVEAQLPFIARLLPPSLSPERFLSDFKTAAWSNPDLLRATPRSVLLACMQAATDGLRPDGREAAVVVRQGVAQYQRMAGGIVTLLYRTGKVASIDLQVVREGDEWDYGMGDSPFIRHKPTLSLEGRIIAAYSIIRLKDGSISRCLMGIEEIDRIMRMSPSGWDKNTKQPKGIWAKHKEEMSKKTVLHRHVKTLPLEGMPTATDDVSQVEDAAWSEPEDYTSQEDSGGTGKASENTENTEILEGQIENPPMDIEVDDWTAELQLLELNLSGCTGLPELETTFDEWDAEHADQPPEISGRAAAIVQGHVARIKAATKQSEDYKKAKGDK